MIEKLTYQQARKLILLSQGIPQAKSVGPATQATLVAIKQLGYIQIDTISIIERAHHHTLWNRNPRYKKSHLHQLLKDKQVFEYWSHAAAYLPMDDYRYSLPRKHAIASGNQKHWYQPDTKLMNAILKRIDLEGPLMAKDFEGSKVRRGIWESKPTKRALECLYIQGDLMVAYRRKFHKVYDLTERVLPEGIDRSMPDSKDHARFLIKRFLRANGLGQINEITYLLKNKKDLVTAAVQEMIRSKELIQVTVGDQNYYALPASLELLGNRLSRKKLKILSPFDNMLIQRKRIKYLFDFDYQLECYLPAHKRRHGYFALPILWDGRLVGRMDCKNDRKEGRLHIYQLSLELNMNEIEAFSQALQTELLQFLSFNSCRHIILHEVSPAKFKPVVQHFINELKF